MEESWEVSIIELHDSISKKYKVTRRFPALKVSETKFFGTKEEAEIQFNEWLKESSS